LLSCSHQSIIPVELVEPAARQASDINEGCPLAPVWVQCNRIPGNKQPLSKKNKETPMSEHSPLNVKSAKLKKALVWMTETLAEHPEKTRRAILQQAELRFDLTPIECEFLDKHLIAPQG
jgi:hypothetical protein